MKKILFLIFLFQLFSVSTVLASDNVVINEFLPNTTTSNKAWIEIYNPTVSSINVNNWKIKNDQNNTIGTFGDINLAPNTFTTIDTADGNLRNDHDTVKLLNDQGIEVDSIPYTSDPQDDHSIGRSTDGGSTIVVFSIPTKGYSNNPATPTPTIVPTITPTLIPTTTPTQTPFITPVPTIIPTASPTIEPTPTTIIVPITPPFNVHEMIEKRMKCRFSYSRFARLPNGAMLLELLKSVFGQNSVCSP